MSNWVWVDDRLVDDAEAVLPYDDHGVTVGDGVFEAVKLEGGAPFALTRHLARLRRSAAALRLPCPDEDRLRDAVDAVASNAVDDGVIRITLTAGRGPLGSPRDESEPRLIVATRPGPVRTDPTPVHLVEWTRNEHGALAGVKSTSYAENVLALDVALAAGASEALFANTAGNLCEGTGSNVFVGFGDDLVTPPLSSGCLAGITRALLLEAGVGREADVALARLPDATEMFLASTTREVQPVTAVSGAALPRCPGPLTLAAQEAWREAHGQGTPRDP